MKLRDRGNGKRRPRSGRPGSSSTPESIEVVHVLICSQGGPSGTSQNVY